jgi:hypothetical protein
MNLFGSIFLITFALLLFIVPRRHAALPLLITSFYMTQGQVIAIGPAHFTVLRLLVVIGFVRVFCRGERLPGGVQPLDGLLLLWAAILLVTGVFHISGALLFRSGVILTELGCYFLLRTFLQSPEDVRKTLLFLCFALAPLAALLLFEKITRANAFSALGGVLPVAQVRHDVIRAQGPFDHPIMAGTVGAALIGIALSVAKISRLASVAGCCSGAVLVYSSGSSGPVMMAGFVVLARVAWILRAHMAAVRFGLVAMLLWLSAVMNDPIYFLMARIDISGGSQGYFRAALIGSAMDHMSEWWAAGTDYTRHWMQSGIHANNVQTDIANQYLAMAVSGGLSLLVVFLLILTVSFQEVGKALGKRKADSEEASRRMIWCLGSLLFGFVMNFISISLYDQSVVFFYLCLAAIVAMNAPASEYRLVLSPRQTRLARLLGRSFTRDTQPSGH